jgi:hypothetical protein
VSSFVDPLSRGIGLARGLAPPRKFGFDEARLLEARQSVCRND